jgi:hypothetical protein
MYGQADLELLKLRVLYHSPKSLERKNKKKQAQQKDHLQPQKEKNKEHQLSTYHILDQQGCVRTITAIWPRLSSNLPQRLSYGANDKLLHISTPFTSRTLVLRLQPVHQLILSLLGPHAEKFYLSSS